MVSASWFGLRVTRCSKFSEIACKDTIWCMFVLCLEVIAGQIVRSSCHSIDCLYQITMHLLKKWASNIGRKDLPLNNNTRVCSLHFQSGKIKYGTVQVSLCVQIYKNNTL